MKHWTTRVHSTTTGIGLGLILAGAFAGQRTLTIAGIAAAVAGGVVLFFWGER